MILMEYPKIPLDGLPDSEKVMALKRQVDILTDNLQIVLNSIEDDSEWEEIKGLIKSMASSSDVDLEKIWETLKALQNQMANLSYNSLLNKPKLEGHTLIDDSKLNEDGIHNSMTNIEIENLINSIT